MTPEEKIARHRKMANGYANAYLRQGVQEGDVYTDSKDSGQAGGRSESDEAVAWQFAEDGVYSSPYFTGSQTFPFSDFPTDTAKASTMEAKAYSLTFSDWKPADFKYWPADNGFVMKTRWEGHLEDGTGMGFYSYSFVETNDAGEVQRWETHVNDEYTPFLEIAIGVGGPFNGTSEYVEALERCLEKAGVSVS